MNRIALTLAALLFASLAQAQIYQWKDANGKTVLSDKPPLNQAVEKKLEPEKSAVDKATPPPTDGKPAEKTLADKDLDFRKRQQEAREREEKSQKEQAYADEKKASCEKTRQYLRALESGVRIRQFDDAGKPSFMDDTLRAQELAKVRQNLQENCQQ